jgi:intein/homing endonuclease
MASRLTNIRSRVRSFMTHDKQSRIVKAATGQTASTLPNSTYDVLQSYGYDIIADYLRLEQDLTSRFVDYEGMDEYPETSAILNIYADDATQPDTPSNKRVWVTSKDKDIEIILNDLLHRTLRIEEEMWSIARSLVKQGNNFEEIIVAEDGVIGLNHLPAHTVRRVEGVRGELYGFVQDFQRRSGYTPREFQQLIAQRNMSAGKTGNLLPGQGFGPPVTSDLDDAVPFENWQVAHFRLRLKSRKALYGHCLAGDSRVWTTRGMVPIEDVRAGDRVYFRHAGMLRTSRVVDQVCSGVKPVYRLKTTHRELRLTEEHPVLRWHGGKNNRWVPLKEVSVGDKLCVATSLPQSEGSTAFGLRLLEMKEETLMRLTERGRDALQTRRRNNNYGPRDGGLRAALSDLDITRSQLEELLKLKSSLPLSQMRALFEAADVPFFDGAVEVKKDPRLALSDFVEPWVARLWGFLTGDGWIHGNQVYFARGVDEDQNCFYESLLEKLGLPVSRMTDVNGTESQAYVSCKALVGLMRDMGWVDGAHHKRVPQWVFTSSREIRESFLQGLQDADGWITHQGAGPSYHFELCNEALLRDVKNLIDGLGWTSGNIRSRVRGDKVITSGALSNVAKGGTSYLLYYKKTPLAEGQDFHFEKVESIELCGEEPVYDIEIAASGHNFIAEGMVVHNSVLEPARWIWKRLMLLEDSALIYRLQRAAERYIYYVNTGDNPPNEAFRLVNMVRHQHKKKKFVNPTTNEIDLKYTLIAPQDDLFIPAPNGDPSTRVEVLGSPNWQCLAGDTEIPLLDGTSITIKEMAEKGGEYEVYSCTEEGRVVPGRAYAPRMSHPEAEIWEVTLDNGEVVSCTGNHPFLTRDGRWVLAEDLTPDTSLMPLYREVSSKKKKGHYLDGHERVYDPQTNTWVYTHHRVFEERHGDPVAKGRAKSKRRPSYAPAPRNHKVVAVRKTHRKEPVYDLTVETHHCFAIGQGVFVHNSMQDLEYFLRKLFSACLVPRAYLSQEEGLNRAVLSQEDVRFARTVMRVQRELKLGLEHICRVHLAALGIPAHMVEFDIHFTIPSSIFELAQIEVKNARADLASRMLEHTSLHYVLDNVYGMSEDDIALIFKQRGDEAELQGDFMGRQSKAAARYEQPMGAAGGGGGRRGGRGLFAHRIPEGVDPRGFVEPSAHSRVKFYNRNMPWVNQGDPVWKLLQEERAGKKNEARLNAKLDELMRSNRALNSRFHDMRGLLQDIRAVAGKRG